ncbi:MAG: TolC family outer membrane protein, partial [Gammaproteobacteria bacterium]|nr:TolC family outer membrane protein [Gammaproteobacteria bacterium]
MKKTFGFNTLIVFLATLAVPGIGHAASLLEVYQQALQGDPRIHEAEARRLAALEAEPQARGVLLPQLDFFGSWTDREDSFSQTQEFPTGLQEFSTDREDEETFWRFQLRQTLFRWDQIVDLRRADKTVAKAEADREAAQQDLVVRVGQTYFDVLGAEDRLTSLHANRQAIARQLEQAKQRFEVGLIAITDVQESQAAYDQAVADEIGAKRSLATAREFLREITGEYVGSLSAPGDEFPMRTPTPASEKDWVDLALGQNLVLVSSRLDEKLARDEISYRRNGHYPTIELVAETFEQDTTRDLRSDLAIDPTVFVNADSNFKRDNSIGIEFRLPLFAGGATSSRVREAVYLHRAAR